MTTALREAIGLSLANLYDVSKHFDEVDTAEERRAALGSACANSEAALNKATAELKISKDQLGRVSADLKKQTSILQDLRDRSTAELNRQIGQAQGVWFGLQDENQQGKASHQRHGRIDRQSPEKAQDWLTATNATKRKELTDG